MPMSDGNPSDADQKPLVIQDYEGKDWLVSETRETAHGFPLYLGVPVGSAGVAPKAFLTSALAWHLSAVRRARDAYDLPITHKTVKRLRRELALRVRKDNDEWWASHLDDLGKLTRAEFAERYGVAITTAQQKHMEEFGRQRERRRPNGWYRAEPARSILLSDRPAREIAATLGITEFGANYCRKTLRREIAAAQRDKAISPNQD